jgi:hypothetical protein
MKCLVVRLALCLGTLASAFAAADAGACGGEEIMPAIDYRVMGVARAEQALRDGHALAAAGSILRMFPEIHRAQNVRAPLVDRASRVLAMAAVRAGGALSKIDKEIPHELSGTWRGATAKERQANLEWSISALRRLNERRQNDPALQTDLGEALSKVEAHGAEALKILGELGDKDLVASPEGYAALAQLRAQAGDTEKRDAAAKKCETMAKNAATCRYDHALPQG